MCTKLAQQFLYDNWPNTMLPPPTDLLIRIKKKLLSGTNDYPCLHEKESPYFGPKTWGSWICFLISISNNNNNEYSEWINSLSIMLSWY